MSQNIEIQIPFNYSIDNYGVNVNEQKNVYRPGVVFRRDSTEEEERNNFIFRYAIPPTSNPTCLTLGLRPSETRHDLLGVNVCDQLRNKYANPDPTLKQPLIHNGPCPIDPFIPSWNKYSASINLESDIKNIFRKKSCGENSVYMPSTNSVMYSKSAMPKDNTLQSGYYALKAQEQKTGRAPSFFAEDTRQTRMGK